MAHRHKLGWMNGKLLRAAGVLALVVVLAGCAREAPVPSESPVESSGTPTPTRVLQVAAGPTAAERTLAAVCAESLRLGGVAVEVVAAPAALGDTLSALGRGEIALYPGFAETLLELQLGGAEPPAPEEVVTELATRLSPKVSLLNPAGLDGRLVWASAGPATWTDALASEAAKVAVVPGFAVERADGVPAVRSLYGAALDYQTLDDPGARREQVASGGALVGAFRALDVVELSGLTQLADDKGVTRADPVAILFTAALADSDPEPVLKVDAAMKALTAEVFGELETRVAGGSDPSEVAAQWVKSKVG
jgi:glycine betaine/choline ABC-type transport system substrate-binding protein